MSSVANPDTQNVSVAESPAKQSPLSGSKSKKNKKKKGPKSKSNGEGVRVNGEKLDDEGDGLDAGDGEESYSPSEPPSTPAKLDLGDDTNAPNGTNLEEREDPNGGERTIDMKEHEDPSRPPLKSVQLSQKAEPPTEDTKNLQDQIAQLQKSLADAQAQYEKQTEILREQLAEATEQKDSAETQYRNLLGKVNTIRSQLGERLKSDAEELSQARSRIEELEEQNASLREQQDAHGSELSALAESAEQRSKELSSLRNRTTLSQQNWVKEREDLLRREAFAKEEFEAAKQAMQDWEVLAIEERSIRESLTEKVSELEDQAASFREASARAASEQESQSATVDGLQRALQEIQDARRRELREIVENSQNQVESLQKQLHDAETQAIEASNSLQSTKLELERVLPFEKEVKEKNLLLGKLRHETVILSDHLRKTLRYVSKKGKPEDSIDKELITNNLMKFLTMERGDPKKFEVLKIMSSLLGWTEEQREQAGLSRPGASNPNSKIPVSPWHRTPSTPVLSADFFPESGNKKESIAELWSGFLEQQAQEEIGTPKSPPSSSSGSRPP